MIVISSDLEITIMKEIHEFGMDNLFKEVNYEVYNKSAVIIEDIKRNNFKPKETVFIGDTDDEILCGKTAGTKTIGVTWGLHSEARLKKAGADFIAHDFKEIESYILKGKLDNS